MQPLTKLGIPKLWGEDPERIWPFARLLTTPVTLLLAPSAGYGLDRVPLEGGGVVAANHFSGIDHPLIGSFCPRPIYFLAKVELMEMPVVGELLSWIGTFPVRRGEADRDALRRARGLVAEGRLVGVHIEGTRQRFGYPGQVHTGGLMIAMQEGAPVIPCSVDTFRWSPANRRRCAVVWGDPIDLSELPRNRSGYDRAAEIVHGEIVRLWRQAAEAAAAGLPSELPDGTKRYGPILRQWSPDRAEPSRVSH
ncbi:MAG: lysophospholipid acyltransferase family protein [Gaiellaceae bacterium]